jgi:hypothetical protein
MSLTWRRSRITGAGLVAAQYDLTLERQTTMDNILFIPGIANPVSEIRQLLFGAGQPGGSWIPSLSAAMIAANTFGSGVTDILDLSGDNNPFSQATPSSRAAWFREPKTGRRNLLIRTDELTNAAWVTINATVASSSVQVPGQTFSVFRITPDITAGNAKGVSQVSLPTGAVAVSVYAKADGYNFLSLGQGSPGSRTFFNLSNGTVGGVAIGSGLTSPQIQSIGDGWFRCSGLLAASSSTIVINCHDTGTVAGNDNMTGNGTSGILVARPQWEIGTAATAPQRVTTAFDVTEAGQRDCYGVRFDGADDWYERAINFSGTDKVTLFVAMRRRSDAARGTVLELTSSIDSNNGAFHLTAPNAASATFGFESKGTTLRDAVITQAMGNPRIITAIGDISGDLASIQVDNGTPITNTGDQGSGNYANSTLYLGRRGGSSLSLNGDIFGVIAAGGEYTAATRQRVRTILSRITPTVNL